MRSRLKNIPSRLRIRILLFPWLILAGCGNTPGPQAETTKVSASDTTLVSSLSPADTLVIREPSAVFFTADSSRRIQMKKQMGDSPYDGVDHECFYQMKNSRTSLKEHWPHVTIYEVESDRVLLFVRKDGTLRPVDLRIRKDLCGLYIFKPEKDPLFGDMMGIGTTLENYFLH